MEWCECSVWDLNMSCESWIVSVSSEHQALLMRVRSVERSWKNDVVRINVFQSSVTSLSSIHGNVSTTQIKSRVTTQNNVKSHNNSNKCWYQCNYQQLIFHVRNSALWWKAFSNVRLFWNWPMKMTNDWWWSVDE